MSNNWNQEPTEQPKPREEVPREGETLLDMHKRLFLQTYRSLYGVDFPLDYNKGEGMGFDG